MDMGNIKMSLPDCMFGCVHTAYLRAIRNSFGRITGTGTGLRRAIEEDGVNYVRGRVARIYEKNGKLIVKGVDTLLGASS